MFNYDKIDYVPFLIVYFKHIHHIQLKIVNSCFINLNKASIQKFI